MKLEKLAEGIYHLRGKDQYEITSHFMRLSEFYESPFKGINGKYFTIEAYMDAYAEKHGNFTYCSDWNGFNVPGNVVRKFFDVFWDDLLEKEANMYDQLADVIESDEKFYLIGSTGAEDYMDHELAHAFYYLDRQYANEMDWLSVGMKAKDRKSVFDKLTEWGYCKKVLNDELQAYMGTSVMTYLTKKIFERENLPWDRIFKYQKLFEETKHKKLDVV